MSDSYSLGWPPGTPLRCQRAERPRPAPHAATVPIRAFAPGFLLGPGPLVAALPVQRLYQVGFVYSPGASAHSPVGR